MSEPEDLIQLHPDLQSQWQAITAHYDRIGLSHSQNPVWNVSFEQLRNNPDYEPSVFILVMLSIKVAKMTIALVKAIEIGKM